MNTNQPCLWHIYYLQRWNEKFYEMQYRKISNITIVFKAAHSLLPNRIYSSFLLIIDKIRFIFVSRA